MRARIESRVRRAIEKFDLPANENLWKTVYGWPGVWEALQKKNGCRITLIGTDKNATLINLILENTPPQANLTVIEGQESTILAAAKKLDQEKSAKIKFLNGWFPQVIPYQKQDLVIAKHFIHFCSAPKVVSDVSEIIGGAGLFFATTPILADLKTRGELRTAKIPFEEKPFGNPINPFGGGVLFVIRFGVETPKICRPLSLPSPAF